ncbi:MAG: ankyrin repeat domain-containing protein [Bacteroidota bacterium]
MKYHILAFILCLPLFIQAQQKNIFHDRSFWSNAPSVALVKAEIEKGNDPVALTSSAFDATVYAILENAPLESIQYLLSLEGNGVDKMTHDKRSYLMWAAYKGNKPLMKTLIEKGSQMDIVDDHGNNLMTFAAVAGNQDTEVYDLILKHGGKVTDANRSGANALLLLAASMTDKSLITYFQEKGLDLKIADHDGNGMFNYAARKGNIETLNMLKDLGLPYKEANKKGENAVFFAASGSRGHVNSMELYKYLEGLGLKMNLVSKEGKTPLHNMAYRVKDEAVISYFLKKGVEVNQVDKDGNTAFLNAIRGSNMAFAHQLKPQVSDLNHQNQDGYSALTYAVMRGSSEAFEMLLEAGADMKVLDKKSRNLVYHMFNGYNSRNKEALPAFLKKAQEAGLDMKPTYEGENTLVHLAVKKGYQALVEEALNLGIDINQKNQEGLTPLHQAAMQAKDKEMLTLLLEKGADKTMLTDFDESAFDLARENEVLAKSGIALDFLKPSSQK